ncbi:MAG: type IVB secretion system protein IcmH/DotU [Gammaproteobacteria bacterium]|nr:type IVB secretion system protein IcmH/DotU [Gammaproteobacteria bacterium]
MLNYFSTVFSYVKELEDVGNSNGVEPSSLRENLESQLNDAMKNAVGDGVDPRNFDSARFAVTAWIDEAVSRVYQENPISWSSQLLQKRFYDTTQAGEQFFLRLEALPDSAIDVLRVFYTCLEFGYRGKYSEKEDQGILMGLKSTYFSKLQKADGSVEDTVASIGKELNQLVSSTPGKNASRILFAVVTIALFCNIAAYLLFRYILQEQAYLGL